MGIRTAHVLALRFVARPFLAGDGCRWWLLRRLLLLLLDLLVDGVLSSLPVLIDHVDVVVVIVLRACVSERSWKQ